MESRADKIYNKLQDMNSQPELSGGAFDLLSGGLLIGGNKKLKRCKKGMARKTVRVQKKDGKVYKRRVCAKPSKNPWIKFLKKHGKKGLTRDELVELYHKS